MLNDYINFTTKNHYTKTLKGITNNDNIKHSCLFNYEKLVFHIRITELYLTT